ncbi:MAG: response regulator [Bacteroidales bacterium]|jgi:CheY-like chemotaxis protein|nr:response regulator [Bacteroidales bacterium]
MKEVCQVNDFLKGLKPEYSKKITALGKRVMFLLDEKNFVPNVSIEVDSEIVKKIMDVLIGNSIKYTEKGYVKIGYKILDNDVIQFFIEDTGVGFSPAALTEMNEKLSNGLATGDNTAQNIIGAAKLAQSIDAKIHIDSQKDMGTTLYISINIQAVVASESNDNAATGSSQSTASSETSTKTKGNPVADLWKGRTILIAEDELVNYMFLEVLFEDTGATLIHASDGQQAIDFAKEHSEIELILMDIKMPNVNGLEATKAIKAFRPQIPVIAQTAYAMQDDEYKALQAGCNEYISKPIDANKLMGLMKKYLHI